MSLDDEIYLQEDYYSKPKESFFFIDKTIQNIMGNAGPVSCLDLGCAKGEFLYFLGKKYPSLTELTGVDISEEMLKEAKENCVGKKFNFLQSDVKTFRKDCHYSLVTACGVLGYVEDPSEILLTMKHHMSWDSTGLIFGFLNADPIDVFTQFSYNGFKEHANFHSLTSLKKQCERLELNVISVSEFCMPFAVKRSESNLRRSWTINTSEGDYFRNGLGQIFKIFLVVIKKII